MFPLLASWLHTLSPFAWKISGDFGVRWYGLSYALAFVISWLVLRWLARRGAARVPHERITDAILIFVMGVVVGGRVGYALIYRPELLWTFTYSAPFWDLLRIHKGGMASHGGIIGVIVASFIIARGWRTEDGRRVGACPALHIMDLTALMCPFGLLLGRLANFVNGELLGSIVAPPGERGPWWAVKFPQELTERPPPLTPRQESELQRLVGEVKLPNESFEEGIRRVIERVQQGSTDVSARLEPLLAARHPSQLYQALAEGVVVGIVVWLVARRPRLPGVVGCWFLISYGALRVVTEVWRLPDAHLKDPRILGLSRGQWLSVVMVCVGVAILAWIVRRGGEKLGGWGRSAIQSPAG